MRKLLALLAVLTTAGVAAPAALAASVNHDLPQQPPASGRVPGFRVTQSQAIAVAARVPAVRREQRSGLLEPTAFVLGRSWAVDYSRGDSVKLRVRVDPLTRSVISVDTGRELGWPQVWHGVHGGRAQRVHVALAVLAVLFLFPFARPPFGRVHVDMVALLSLGVSFIFAARGDVWVATPLLYPPLLYLAARLFAMGARGSPGVPLSSWMSTRWLAVGVLAMLAGRYAFNVLDPFVSDIGYASLYGADSIKHGYDIYDAMPGSGNLDTYGPFAYLAYVPFSVLIPFDLSRATVGGAQLAAICFDLATVGGLVVLGRRLRDGRLGWLLAWGFTAFPFTFFPLSSSTNDALVAALLTWLLVVALRPAWRGFVLGLAVATKFAPAILAGVFWRVGRTRGRAWLPYVSALVLTVAVLVWAFLPDGGIREFYDATLGFQMSRGSPFSMWGLHPSWQPAQVLMELVAVTLACVALVVPRERDEVSLAAVGAALLIVVQLTAVHWYWFYIPWFLPYALVALIGGPARGRGTPRTARR